MSETKNTPGPWTAKYASQSSALIEIYNTEDRILVAVLPDRGTIEAMPEIEANANLIAAAPDMYEALKESCLDCLLEQDFCDFCYIGKALRKARGEEE